VRLTDLPKTREPLGALGQQTIPIKGAGSESSRGVVSTGLRSCRTPLRHDNAQLSLSRTLCCRRSKLLRRRSKRPRRSSTSFRRNSATLRLHRSSRHHTAQGCSHQRLNFSSHSTRLCRRSQRLRTNSTLQLPRIRPSTNHRPGTVHHQSHLVLNRRSCQDTRQDRSRHSLCQLTDRERLGCRQSPPVTEGQLPRPVVLRAAKTAREEPWSQVSLRTARRRPRPDTRERNTVSPQLKRRHVGRTNPSPRLRRLIAATTRRAPKVVRRSARAAGARRRSGAAVTQPGSRVQRHRQQGSHGGGRGSGQATARNVNNTGSAASARRGHTGARNGRRNARGRRCRAGALRRHRATRTGQGRRSRDSDARRRGSGPQRKRPRDRSKRRSWNTSDQRRASRLARRDTHNFEVSGRRPSPAAGPPRNTKAHGATPGPTAATR